MQMLSMQRHLYIYARRHCSKTLIVYFDSFIEARGANVYIKVDFSTEDFHGIWESLIFDSDVKAQVRK